MPGKYIGICGIDCETCETRIATKNNDDALRREVAEKWSRLNNVTILPEMINCDGCRMAGKKTVYCEQLCEIRRCARKMGYETCGECARMETCGILGMIAGNRPEAIPNLKK
ncbi:MAG TPA: DUF3795 domain-containing protein [Methanocorpusculum sp.]|nr:DUF3795 domain-containing protein [Methanocorpusculum sp.]